MAHSRMLILKDGAFVKTLATRPGRRLHRPRYRYVTRPDYSGFRHARRLLPPARGRSYHRHTSHTPSWGGVPVESQSPQVSSARISPPTIGSTGEWPSIPPAPSPI